MNPLPHIYECLAKDSLRPAMERALITRDKTVVTDAHILIEHSSLELFDQEFLDQLPKDGIFLGKEALQDLAKKDVYTVRFLEDVKIIEVTHKNKYGQAHKRYYEALPVDSVDYKFPNYEVVFPGSDKKKQDISSIGLNPVLLARLYKAMGKCRGVYFTFYGDTTSILCKPAGGDYLHCRGIIMPILPS